MRARFQHWVPVAAIRRGLGVVVVAVGAVFLAMGGASDPVAIDGYLGKGRNFTAAISRFAELYADQNERDHARLVGAIAAGAVESLPG